MFTSADAIQKDNKDNAAISQDAQRRNAGLTESTNNPDGAAAAVSKMCCNGVFIWRRIRILHLSLCPAVPAVCFIICLNVWF